MGKHDGARSRHQGASVMPSLYQAARQTTRFPRTLRRVRMGAAHSRSLAWHGGARLLPASTMRTAEIEPVIVGPQRLGGGSLALLEATELAPVAAPQPVAARRHILIVEDDAPMAGVVRNALELEGDPDWSVEMAAEGVRALELAAGAAPDVVLLDVRLPGLDGGEVYRRLRASHPTGRMRVLFLTAGTSLDLYQRGIDDGVLLRKPFDVQELVRLVRALLTE